MNNPSAFPISNPHNYESRDGMTLRDYFAAKVMQGICASDPVSAMTNGRIAAESYALADAMLKAREA